MATPNNNRLTFTVDIDTAAARRALAGLHGAAGNPFSRWNIPSATREVGLLGNQLRGLGTILAGYATIQGLSGIATSALQASQHFASANANIKLVSGSLGEMRDAQARVYDLAQRTGQSYTKLSELYRTMNATAVGLGRSDGFEVTEVISKLLSVDRNSNANGADAAMVQFGQLMTSKLLSAEELNSIREGAPMLAAAIIRGLREQGFAVNSLRDVNTLSIAGKVTNANIPTALISQRQWADQIYGAAPQSVGSAMQTVQNSWEAWTNKLDQQGGFSRTITSALRAVSSEIDASLNDPKFDEAARKVGERFRGIVGDFFTFVEDAKKGLAPLWDDAAAKADTAGTSIGNRLLHIGKDAEEAWGKAQKLIGDTTEGIRTIKDLAGRLPDGMLEYGALGFLLGGRNAALVFGGLAALNGGSLSGLVPGVSSSPAPDGSAAPGAAAGGAPAEWRPSWQSGALAGYAGARALGLPAPLSAAAAAGGAVGGAAAGLALDGYEGYLDRDNARIVARMAGRPLQTELDWYRDYRASQARGDILPPMGDRQKRVADFVDRGLTTWNQPTLAPRGAVTAANAAQILNASLPQPGAYDLASVQAMIDAMPGLGVGRGRGGTAELEPLPDFMLPTLAAGRLRASAAVPSAAGGQAPAAGAPTGVAARFEQNVARDRAAIASDPSNDGAIGAITKGTEGTLAANPGDPTLAERLKNAEAERARVQALLEGDLAPYLKRGLEEAARTPELDAIQERLWRADVETSVAGLSPAAKASPEQLATYRESRMADFRQQRDLSAAQDQFAQAQAAPRALHLFTTDEIEQPYSDLDAILPLLTGDRVAQSGTWRCKPRRAAYDSRASFAAPVGTRLPRLVQPSVRRR